MALPLCGPGSNPGADEQNGRQSQYRWRIQVRVAGPDREIYRHDGCLTPIPRVEKRPRSWSDVESDEGSSSPTASDLFDPVDMQERLWPVIRSMPEIRGVYDLDILISYLWCLSKRPEFAK